MLLISEHFKAQTHGRFIVHKVESSKDMKIFYLSSDTEDSVGLHSDDEEEVGKIIKDLGKNKTKSEPKIYI